MHEMSIAQSLVELIQEEMDKNNVQRLLKVKLLSGQINAIVPEAMQTAFQALTAGTKMQDAQLVIEHIPLTLACGKCRHQFIPQGEDYLFFNFPCPECGQDFGHQVIAGKELNIDYIEAE